MHNYRVRLTNGEDLILSNVGKVEVKEGMFTFWAEDLVNVVAFVSAGNVIYVKQVK